MYFLNFDETYARLPENSTGSEMHFQEPSAILYVHSAETHFAVNPYFTSKVALKVNVHLILPWLS